MGSFIFLALFLITDYEYQLDPVINECNIKYGAPYWEFCPILKIPYEIKDSLNLPNIFSGQIINASCSTRLLDPGIVWENDKRDSSFLVVKYRSHHQTKYKIFWFISKK